MHDPQATETQLLDFGPFRLDLRQRLLFRDGAPVALPRKALEVLIALTEEPGALQTKEELLARVWPDVVVDEANLSQTVFVLRKALGDEAGQWIATVTRRGYRFSGELTKVDAEETRQTGIAERPRRMPLVIAAAVILVVAIAAIITVKLRPTGSGIHSIAVLPFRPLDERRGDRPLELGIADTLTTKLSGLPNLVLSPTRAIAGFIDHPSDPLASGRSLDVDGVVEGNIQREGRRVRCSVRLLRVSDGRALLAEDYDEDAGDLFVLEDHVAQRVADALDLRLNGRGGRNITKRYTQNADAYQLYTQGRFEWSSFKRDGLLSSVRYYEAALQRDPRYALAWASLADSYSVIGVYGVMPAGEAFGKSREAALRALAIDHDLARAHAALAASDLLYTHNWREADEELHRALVADPNEVDAHSLRVYLLEALGRPDEAVAEARRAHDLDPTWNIPKTDALKALFLARRYDEAIAEGRRVLPLEPQNIQARNLTSRALMERGLLGEAAALEKAPGTSEADPRAASTFGAIAARTGDRATALKVIESLRSARGHGDLRAGYELAIVFCALGDANAAFISLDESLASHFPFIYEVRVDPQLDPLRKDPRFAAFLSKLGLDRN